MSRLVVLAAYLVAVFAGAALVAPWLWTAAQGLAGSGDAGWAGFLARHPFHRYVHRCLLFLALAGLWPLGRAFGCRSLEALGLRRDAASGGATRQALRGWQWATVMFGVALAWELGTGTHRWRESIEGARLLGSALRALGSGAAVAVVEELLFRGLIYGGLRPAIGCAPALAVSSGLYALMHLFQRPPRPDTVGPWSGFETVGAMLAGWGDPAAWLPGGVTLVLAGGLLGWGYQRTGALFFPMGLHAGWVTWAKLRGGLTRPVSVDAGTGPRGAWDGWAELGLLLAAVLVVTVWERRRSAVSSELPASESGEGSLPAGTGL